MTCKWKADGVEERLRTRAKRAYPIGSSLVGCQWAERGHLLRARSCREPRETAHRRARPERISIKTSPAAIWPAIRSAAATTASTEIR
jgi:hypothetical protein